MSTYSALPLISELRSRFPIIDQTSGSFGGYSRERIPWFFGLILAAAASDDSGPCCIVLDKTRGTAALAAVLLSLSRFSEDFLDLASEYARTALNEGDRVRVRPSDFVYEYEGIWNRRPDIFRLKVQGKQERRSFPISEVLRLEPTSRVRPQGKLSSDLGDYQQSSLDRLLNIITYGNHSLMQNTVLMHMASTQFARFSELVSLTPGRETISDTLSDSLPWGTIGPDGEMRTIDSYQVVGEPLIAVTNSIYDLAAAALKYPPASKVVIVDSAHAVSRDLQVLDDISDSQRTLILASPDEEEALRILRDRDCPVWHMSPVEVLIGEDDPSARFRSSLLGHTIRAAETRKECRVVPVPCTDDRLEGVASHLEAIDRRVSGEEVRTEVDTILGLLYGVLLEMSECFFGVTDAAREKLQRATAELQRNRIWLARDVTEDLQFVVDELESISVDGLGTESKRNAFLDLLADTKGRRVLATRSSGTAAHFEAELSGLGVNLPVVPVQLLNPKDEYDCVIIPSWPGRRRFTRLRNIAVTPDIRVLVFPFEHRWVVGYGNRERRVTLSNQVCAEVRGEMLDIEPDLLPPAESYAHEPRRGSGITDPPIFELESRIADRPVVRPPTASGSNDARLAKLVEFNGGCYTLLTEWAQLHVLTELIYGFGSEESSIRTATVNELSKDDFVLFRAGTDKDFLRLLAEDILGAEIYEANRGLAERWKSSLLRLGDDVDRIQSRLERFGLDRTYQTISNWINNPYHIGPNSLDDIRIIAESTRDSFLLSRTDAVWQAITMIRRSHIRAGHRLTQFILEEIRGRLGQLDGQPELIEFGYGQAWVVQVRTIDEEQLPYPADDVNRLLWVSDLAF